MSYFLVFDVESVGLHGEGYAFGYVVVGRDGVEVESGRVACPPEKAMGDKEGRDWIAANVPKLESSSSPHLPPEIAADLAFGHPSQLRNAFWATWMRWKRRGASLFAECCWPVESRFLAACIDDDPAGRYWDGPYPLHDVASVRLAAGLDPLETVERIPIEMPAHDPLADARQSARLLIEAMDLIGRKAD